MSGLTTRFEQHVTDRVLNALKSVDAAVAEDVYAVSFYVYDDSDDPRRPTLEVGYNTNAQWKSCSPSRGKSSGWPIASDSNEAKWNYAFWLQNSLLKLGLPGTDSAALCEEWLKADGLWYTDEEDEQDFDKCDEVAEAITQTFTALCVRIARSLHDSGIIEQCFKRPIPVLVHELEYYDQIAEQTEQANPPGLAKEFVAWVRAGT
jgi:hypothetical protein